MSRLADGDIQIEKNDTVKVEDRGFEYELPVDDTNKLAELLQQAKNAQASEHKMTTWQAIKRYPKASAWSIAISFGVIMEGVFGVGLC